MRGGAEQAERGFGFDRKLDVCQTYDLLGLVENGSTPDVDCGLAAETEPALLLFRMNKKRDQKAVARGRDADLFDSDLSRAAIIFGECLAGELCPRGSW